MKKVVYYLLSCLLMISLVGCKEEKVDDPIVDKSGLTALRDEMKNEMMAIGFYGYFPYDLNEVDSLFESLNVYEKYPFIIDIKDEVIDYEGDELYLVVCKDPKAVVTVYEFVIDEETYEEKKGKILYTSKDGKPFILSANVSDIFSNVLIHVKDSNGKELEYQPRLSMMDSTIEINGVEGLVKDISSYDVIYNTDNNLLKRLEIEELYGEYSCEYSLDNVMYNIGLSIYENGKVSFYLGEKDQPYTVFYEGSYECESEFYLPNGQIKFDLILKSNESKLELSEYIGGVYQFIPLAYEDGYRMKVVEGDTIFSQFEYNYLLFEPTVG